MHERHRPTCRTPGTRLPRPLPDHQRLPATAPPAAHPCRRPGTTRRPPNHRLDDASPRPAPGPDRQRLAEVLARSPELDATSRLVRGFAEILTTRSGQHLKDWIAAIRAEDLPGLPSFATGLEKDWDAVIQGLTSQWNSGPVESHVNHFKMIKRQMFGRAKLPLLRKRVLLTAAR
ncbi:transposase [Streptomyces sp. NBC_00467]|uniref:transposase n=1 Tax=Streptomyces sp. NBC_00467 TaxID=2975752 RepID=UPI002E1750A7